jgi:hypothetical protein
MIGWKRFSNRRQFLAKRGNAPINSGSLPTIGKHQKVIDFTKS